MKIRFERTLHYEINTDWQLIIDLIKKHTDSNMPFAALDINMYTTDEDLLSIFAFLKANTHLANVSPNDYIHNITIDDRE